MDDLFGNKVDYEKKAKKGQTATKESSKLKKILRDRDKEVKKI